MTESFLAFELNPSKDYKSLTFSNVFGDPI